MDAITLILQMLVTARLTRLVTTDTIIEDLRIRVIRRFGTDSKLSYLIMCDWCSSIYVGTAVGVSWYLWHGSVLLTAVSVALAGSYVAGFLNSKVDD